MAHRFAWGDPLEPGDAVRTFELTAAQFNDLHGTVVASEMDGRVLIELVLTDGSKTLKKLKPANLLLVYDCARCGAQDVQLRCPRCKITGKVACAPGGPATPPRS